MAEMFPWCYNWNGIWATWPNCSPVLQTEFYLGQMAEMLSLCYQRKGIETTRQGSTARVLKKTWFLSKGTNINTGWNIHITFCILHICCKQVPVTLKLSRRVLEVLKSNIYFATFLKQSRNKPGYLDSRKKNIVYCQKLFLGKQLSTSPKWKEKREARLILSLFTLEAYSHQRPAAHSVAELETEHAYSLGNRSCPGIVNTTDRPILRGYHDRSTSTRYNSTHVLSAPKYKESVLAINCSASLCISVSLKEACQNLVTSLFPSSAVAHLNSLPYFKLPVEVCKNITFRYHIVLGQWRAATETHTMLSFERVVRTISLFSRGKTSIRNCVNMCMLYFDLDLRKRWKLRS